MSNIHTKVMLFISAISSAQDLEKDVDGPTSDSIPAEKKLAVFDKIFTAYQEARSSIRSDLVWIAGQWSLISVIL